MAARTILLTDVLAGLTGTVLVNDISGAAAEIVQIQNVKSEDFIINEESEEIITPTVSVGVERVNVLSNKVTVEFTIDENETDVITTVRGLGDSEGEIIFTTAEGGDNGTGKTVTITAANIRANMVEGHKVKFTLTKKVAGSAVPYAVAHVSA